MGPLTDITCIWVDQSFMQILDSAVPYVQLCHNCSSLELHVSILDLD